MVHGVILYKYMPLEAFFKTIENWSLKATYPTATNDPLEFIPQGDYYVKAVRDKDALLPYFHSFSSKVADVAMWGRYGDSSHGVCLAFCFPTDREVAFSGEERTLGDYAVPKCGNLFPVSYEDERVLVKIGSLYHSEEDAYIRMLTTKAKSWEGESEFRFVDYICDADSLQGGHAFYKKYMGRLCGVILGDRCRYGVPFIANMLMQIRKLQGVENDLIHVNDIPLMPKLGGGPMLVRCPICVVQAKNAEEEYKINNAIFEDDMTLERYMKKVRDAKIMEIPDPDGAV